MPSSDGSRKLSCTEKSILTARKEDQEDQNLFFGKSLVETDQQPLGLFMKVTGAFHLAAKEIAAKILRMSHSWL